jgi:hypothetical protein
MKLLKLDQIALVMIWMIWAIALDLQGSMEGSQS